MPIRQFFRQNLPTHEQLESLYEDVGVDPNHLHLRVSEGRQWWVYEPGSTSAQSNIDQYWLRDVRYNPKTPVQNRHVPDSISPINALDAARKGFAFVKTLQTENGHFASEYPGPMFLGPGFVIAWYIMNVQYHDPEAPQLLKPWERAEMKRYMINTANTSGGWGLHTEAESTLFCSVLNYVALRLLGCPHTHPVLVRALRFIRKHGGAVGVPSWGKFWLSLLNLYDWDGMDTLLPEMWNLPYWTPFHPGKLWIHCRMVYLPMGYFYGLKIAMKPNDLITQLRKELYLEDYDTIDWSSHRHNVCPLDVHHPFSTVYKFCFWFLNLYERYHPSWLRKLGIETSLKYMRNEDKNTHYLDLAPVNKAMNMIAAWHYDGPMSTSNKNHIACAAECLWECCGGYFCCGTNGLQAWDTSLLLQALIESGLAGEFQDLVDKAYVFLDDCQIKENAPYDTFRQDCAGSWPFSNRWQGYNVSDCTAEALRSVLQMGQRASKHVQRIPLSRLQASIDVLLSQQNPDDKGFCSYEPRRASTLLELLNPASVFGRIMVEYTYPECTSSVILGLTEFQRQYPDYRTKEIHNAIESAVSCLFREQNADGSWFGSWAVCYTYATWFVLEALKELGLTYESSPQVRKACHFLLEKQNSDGGWGEHWRSCTEMSYVTHPDGSQVVQTAWSCLALMAAAAPQQDRVEAGIKVILSRQVPETGEFLEEGICGVFNKTTMIRYTFYKFIFPLWALGRYGARH